ncbi:MAG: fatty acid desaturase [Saprospiraceae bacterium]
MDFGGFNSHAAHHLFPKIPHTLYTEVTPYIQKYAARYNLPYHQLSMLAAIRSHFLYLKKLGAPMPEKKIDIAASQYTNN